MSDTSSEEKSLPASDKKLRDARKKGEVAKSQDLVSGVVILVSTIFLMVVEPSVQAKIERLIDLASRIYTAPFLETWPQLVAIALQILVGISLPMLLVIVAMVVLTNIGVMQGLIFSGDPIVPKFERINPVSGFKRIFGMKGIIDFLKALFKVAALACAFVVVFRNGLQGLFDSSACGAACIRQSFFSILQPLVITAVIAFLFVGLLDVKLQDWLFRREMKMTKSERKRESRDIDGDPLIRQARNRQRKGMQTIGSKTGLMNASVLVGAPENWTVGIRYVKGETPVPMVVCRATPEQASTMITQALLAEIPVIRNGALARAISRGAGIGNPVPEETFQPIADLLVASKLI